MLFTSYEFACQFLPVTLALFFCVGTLRPRLAVPCLALASLYFYARWNVRFVGLLLGSIAFNYACASFISRASEPRRKRILTFALATNLATLGCFKYGNFFLDTLHGLTGLRFPSLALTLPLGISFFTFTQIAFLVDVHRGIARERNLAHYALFVTYFPHLIAGPVLHHAQLMPQFANRAIHRLRAANFAPAAIFFAIGLAKKVLLADGLGVHASLVFDGAAAGVQPGFAAAWTGAVAYALQIYFDFSGYCDMAIGLSLLFGIDLPLNFDSPYKASSIIDFWQRWHMTLSRFLRDYLYIPLGGNRNGPGRRYLNLAVTMLLGGLWHGASWTFVAWGALHGAYLIANHGWRALRGDKRARPWMEIGPAACTALTFTVTVVAWVFFRAVDFSSAWRMLGAMAGLGGSGAIEARLDTTLTPLGLIAAGLGICFALPNSQQLVANYRMLANRPDGVPRDEFRIAAWGLFAAVLLFSSVVWQFGADYDSPFLYFQF